jgi:hypothetical protein
MWTTGAGSDRPVGRPQTMAETIGTHYETVLAVWRRCQRHHVPEIDGAEDGAEDAGRTW